MSSSETTNGGNHLPNSFKSLYRKDFGPGDPHASENPCSPSPSAPRGTASAVCPRSALTSGCPSRCAPRWGTAGRTHAARPDHYPIRHYATLYPPPHRQQRPPPPVLSSFSPSPVIFMGVGSKMVTFPPSRCPLPQPSPTRVDWN